MPINGHFLPLGSLHALYQRYDTIDSYIHERMGGSTVSRHKCTLAFALRISLRHDHPHSDFLACTLTVSFLFFVL